MSPDGVSASFPITSRLASSTSSNTRVATGKSGQLRVPVRCQADTVQGCKSSSVQGLLVRLMLCCPFKAGWCRIWLL